MTCNWKAGKRLAVAGLVALMGGAGVMHFVAPDKFAEIVPPQLGNARFWVLASGVVELSVAALLVPRRTRCIGALACITLLVAVFPANVYAALKGGYESFSPPFDSAAVAWGRLPFQAVLIWWAWRVRSAD